MFDIKQHRENLNTKIKTLENQINFFRHAIDRFRPYDGKVFNKHITEAVTDDKIKAYISGQGAGKRLVIFTKDNPRYTIDITCAGRYQPNPLITDKNRFIFDNFRRGVVEGYILHRRTDMAEIKAELAAGEEIYAELAKIKAYYIELSHQLAQETITDHEQTFEISSYEMRRDRK